MDQREATRIYEFGGYRLDRRRRILFGLDGKPIALNPKVFDTLLYFVEHAGELLEKTTLIAAIWPNLVVEENNLNKHVSTLRRVLSETPDEHRFIVTEPGRGYRFLAKVEIDPAEPSPASPVDPAAVPAVAVSQTRAAAVGVLTLLAVGAIAIAVLLMGYVPRETPSPPEVRFE